MSDSSSSGSARAFRVKKSTKKAATKRKAKSSSSSSSNSSSSNSSSSAKTAKTKKSTKKNSSSSPIKINAPNFTKIARGLKIAMNSPNTTRKLLKRLKPNQAKKFAKKLDKDLVNAVYKKLTKKAKRSLNVKDKRLITAVATNASRSGSLNIDRLIGHLKKAPVFLSNVAKVGKEKTKAFKEKHNAELKAKKEDLKKMYDEQKAYQKAYIKAAEEEYAQHLKMAKSVVANMFERIFEGTDKKASSKDISDVSKLRAHGYTITAAEHLILKSHKLDDHRIAHIRARLIKEGADDMSACAQCDLENYLMNV